MKFFNSSYKVLCFIVITIYLQNFNSTESINGATQEVAQKICPKGYSGINCSIPTCEGNNSCMAGSTCHIKDNKPICICRVLTSIGTHKEIENCNRIYFILNGICFSNSSGSKICLCLKDWMGDNCDTQILQKEKNSIIAPYLKTKQINCEGIGTYCNFTDYAKIKYEGCCTLIYRDNHQTCYRLYDTFADICECDDGWDGAFDCSSFNCDFLNNCNEHGNCSSTNMGTCECATGYGGKQCEFKCQGTCKNGQFINDEMNNCICDCHYPYLPPTCEYITPPTSTSFTTDKMMEEKINSVSTAAINGIIIGCCLAILLIIAAIATTIVIIKRNKHIKRSLNTSMTSETLLSS